MSITELLKNDKPILIDGSMGAILIKKGLGGAQSHQLNIKNPDILTEIHTAYLEAGCDIIMTNTFNITPESMEKAGLTIEETVRGAVSAAKKATSSYQDRYIALDLGPSGKMIAPLGNYTFQDAYEHFQQQVNPVKDDVDLFIIETISDLNDMKAAVSAIRDISDKPIFAAMTFTEKAKTWLGVSLQDWADLANELDIDAAGINCTLTPQEMLPVATQFKALCKKRVFAEPNRGQPVHDEHTTTYLMSAEEYANGMMDLYDIGITILGGCCGSDPECMKLVKESIEARKTNY